MAAEAFGEKERTAVTAVLRLFHPELSAGVFCLKVEPGQWETSGQNLHARIYRTEAVTLQLLQKSRKELSKLLSVHVLDVILMHLFLDS